MNVLRSLVATTLVVGAVNVYAADKDTWGLVSGSYNVGASKLVTKDIGTLEINVNVTCADQVSVANEKVAEAVAQLKLEIENGSEFTLTTDKPDVVVSSQEQYELAYRDNNYLAPYYVDTCNNNAEVSLGVGILDLGKNLFTASTSLKVETRKDLSSLTALRQKLQAYAEKQNKVSAAVQVAVNTESIYVSEEKTASEIQKLNNEASLTGTSNRTRLDVDLAVYGGAKDRFITSPQASYPEYKEYSPELTADGKSKVTVPYTFSVQYIPSNLEKDSTATYPLEDKGTLTEVLQGVAVVDTDYYVARLSFSSSCQPTKEAAIASAKEAYESFSKIAATVTADNGSDFERVEETLGQPQDDGKWRALVQVRDPQTNATTVKSYVSLCNSNVVDAVKAEDRTYAVTHRLTVVTSNYAGLKDLEAKANAYTEEQRKTAGAQRVEVVMQNIEPRLLDKNHFNAVEVLAYESAVAQFLNPQGAVANKLLDQVQASEAYYTSVKGNISPRAAKAVRFEAAAPMPESAGAAGASDYVVVVTSEGNIPMTELRADNNYSVTFRPEKDLVQVLKEGRAPVAPAATVPELQ